MNKTITTWLWWFAHGGGICCTYRLTVIDVTISTPFSISLFVSFCVCPCVCLCVRVPFSIDVVQVRVTGRECLPHSFGLMKLCKIIGQHVVSWTFKKIYNDLINWWMRHISRLKHEISCVSIEIPNNFQLLS